MLRGNVQSIGVVANHEAFWGLRPWFESRMDYFLAILRAELLQPVREPFARIEPVSERDVKPGFAADPVTETVEPV